MMLLSYFEAIWLLWGIGFTLSVTSPLSNLETAVVGGSSLMVKNGVAIVGSVEYQGSGHNMSGAAYIYNYDTNLLTWKDPILILPSSSHAFDRFGCSVAIDSNFTVVGACYSDELKTDSGAVYVYYNSNGWSQNAILLPGDGNIGDGFGSAVAVQGNGIDAASAAFVSSSGCVNSDSTTGCVYIFARTAFTAWTQMVKLKPPDPEGMRFGYSLAISGKFLVIGAPGTDQNEGKVYLFEPISAKFSALQGSHATDGAQFGYSVSGDAGRIAVGSCCNATHRAVYIYEYSELQWSQHSRLISDAVESTNDQYGHSVSISGTRLAVGAPSSNVDGVDTGIVHAFNPCIRLHCFIDVSGSVYLYDMKINQWSQQMQLVPDIQASENHFGSIISMQSEDLLVTADDGSIVFIYGPSEASPTPAPTTANVENIWLQVIYPDNTTEWKAGLKTFVQWRAPSYTRLYTADVVMLGEGMHYKIGGDVQLDDLVISYYLPKYLPTSDDYMIQFVVKNFVEPGNQKPPFDLVVNSSYFKITGKNKPDKKNTLFLSMTINQIAITSGFGVVVFLLLGIILYRDNRIIARTISKNATVIPKDFDEVDTGYAVVENPDDIESHVEAGDAVHAMVMQTRLINTNKEVNARWHIYSEDLDLSGKVLGKGGFGVVKEGKWRDGQRTYDVAIKVLLGANFNEKAVEELKREADLMVTLRSPFIVQILGLCDEECLLVMELMAHGPLHKWIQSVVKSSAEGVKQSTFGLRLQFMQDCIRGLQYLHSKNIIHRDLKSPNILLKEEGGGLKAKLADFGLAKISMNEFGSTTANQAMSLLWAAPEQFSDHPHISKSVDIFAFAIVMWELVTLRVPHEGKGLAQVIRSVTTGLREEIPAKTPEAIANLIRRCWAQESEDRPKASAVMEELLNMEMA